MPLQRSCRAYELQIVDFCCHREVFISDVMSFKRRKEKNTIFFLLRFMDSMFFDDGFTFSELKYCHNRLYLKLCAIFFLSIQNIMFLTF